MSGLHHDQYLEHDVYVKEKRIKAITEDVVDLLRIRTKLTNDVNSIKQRLSGVVE